MNLTLGFRTGTECLPWGVETGTVERLGYREAEGGETGVTGVPQRGRTVHGGRKSEDVNFFLHKGDGL